MCLRCQEGERTHFLPNTSGILAKNGANPPESRPGNEAKPKGLALTEKSRQKTVSHLRGTLRPGPFLCFSEHLLPQGQTIGGPAVLDLLHLFAQPKLVEVLIQEKEPVALFAWCGSSVTDPIQQFASHRLNVRVGIGFLVSQYMPNRDEQLARNGHNRLLFANASTQPLKLNLQVADDVR